MIFKSSKVPLCPLFYFTYQTSNTYIFLHIFNLRSFHEVAAKTKNSIRCFIFGLIVKQLSSRKHDRVVRFCKLFSLIIKFLSKEWIRKLLRIPRFVKQFNFSLSMHVTTNLWYGKTFRTIISKKFHIEGQCRNSPKVLSFSNIFSFLFISIAHF